MRYVLGCVLAVCLAVPVVEAAKEEKPLTPAEAIKMVNKEVTVEMKVRSSKNALAQHHEIYLGLGRELPRREELGRRHHRGRGRELKEAGIDNPADHFRDKTIRVTGTVTLKNDRPRSRSRIRRLSS